MRITALLRSRQVETSSAEGIFPQEKAAVHDFENGT
jgi:hypothetical protein